MMAAQVSLTFASFDLVSGGTLYIVGPGSSHSQRRKL
jgi:hypothetical protein